MRNSVFASTAMCEPLADQIPSATNARRAKSTSETTPVRRETCRSSCGCACWCAPGSTSPTIAAAGNGERRDVRERNHQHQRKHRHGEKRSRKIGRQRAPQRHDRRGNDRDCNEQQSVQPTRVTSACGTASAKSRHEHRRGQREPDPRADRAGRAGSKPSEQHSRLRTCRTGQKLCERDALAESCIVEPASPLDEFALKIGKMRDGAAERRTAQTKEGQKDVEDLAHVAVEVRHPANSNLRSFKECLKAVDLSSTTVYASGTFCRYDEAKVGLLTHGLQYGTGCFEGIRGYWSSHRTRTVSWCSCASTTIVLKPRRRF